MNPDPSNPSMPAPDALWYYADASNEPLGPFPMDVLQRLAGMGVIQPQTQVIEKGGSEWREFVAVVPPPTRAEPIQQPSRGERKPRARVSRRIALILSIAALAFVAILVNGRAKLKIGERRTLAAGSFVFADEAAYREYLAAKSANDLGALKNLDRANRAFPFEKEIRVFVSTLNGFAGLTQFRVWKNDGTRDFYWTASKNLIPRDPPKNFHEGDKVVIAEKSNLVLKPELITALQIAEANDDTTKVKELLSRLSEGSVHLEQRTVAKIVTANNETHIHKVEGTLPDGSLFQRWVGSRKLTPYASERNPQDQLSKVPTPSPPELIFPKSGDTLNGAEIENFEDIVEAIYDGKVSAQLASRYAYRFGNAAVEHCKFSHIAGKFLVFHLTAASENRRLEFAMRRDPILEREEAIIGLIEGDDGNVLQSPIYNGKALALGALRIIGMEQFTTATGLVKVIPIVTFVP